ncbi:MAG: metallophosphoesterase [Polyangiales bacterium]
MFLCAAGDTHGAIDRLYVDVLAFEASIGVEFAWVLHVDFGVWPDPNRVDGATKRHDGAGDFPAWAAARRTAPRHTLFIKGNHEDFAWLDAQPSSEVLPGLFYLRNGTAREIAFGDEFLRVGGIGGCHGPSNFDRPSRSLQGYQKRHYTRDEVAALGARDELDVVLTHDAPAGVVFERHRQGARFVSDATGLDDLLARTRPRVRFFGHHHTRIDAEVAGVRCIGLNKVGYPGHLVAIEMRPGEPAWRVLGEWPRRER